MRFRKYILLLLWAPAVGAQSQHASKPLSITVAAATSHSVALTWQASPGCQDSNGNGIACPATVTYNVYRSAVSGGGATATSAYCCLLAGVGTALAYTDAAVGAGQTFFYVVTAALPACSATITQPCGESQPSNEVQAVIPAAASAKKRKWWKL